jgi:DNA-nicking Smr family endonuclease
METLDLHGVRYNEAERLVENFLCMQDLPAKIITGNSLGMKAVVQLVLDRFSLQSELESHWNLGALIVTEKPKS